MQKVKNIDPTKKSSTIVEILINKALVRKMIHNKIKEYKNQQIIFTVSIVLALRFAPCYE